MKKIYRIHKLIFLFCAIYMLSSCSSDTPLIDSTDGGTKETSTVIRIKIDKLEGFSSDLRSASLTMDDVQMVYYGVFENGTTPIRHKFLKKDEFVNGIKDTLPNGEYRVVICAATEDAIITSSNSTYGWSIASASYNDLKLKWTNGTSDFFMYQADLNLDNIQESLDIVLERLTAKIEVLPTDLNHARKNMESVQIFFASPDRYFYIQNYKFVNNQVDYVEGEDLLTIGLGVIPTVSSKIYTRDEFLKIDKDNPISLFVLASEKVENKKLFALVKYDDKTYEYIKLKESCELRRNTILRLSGTFFNNGLSGIGDMNIIEDEWNNIIDDTIEGEQI